VAVLEPKTVSPDQGRVARLQRAARTRGVEISVLGVGSVRDLEEAFHSMGPARPDGLLLVDDLLGSVRGEIARFALQQRLVTAGSDRVFVQAGGLLAYGASLPDLYERSAFYAGRILKGARPSELPVEEPRRFELAVNRATAKAIGLSLPQSLLMRVDHFVE
jgi:putative ABC transport system substrate-binding protein